MKTILFKFKLLILLLIFSKAVYPQWTSDPANPTAVCVAADQQSSLKSFPDGDGGLYLFWLDKRSGDNKNDVYGQHYNDLGEAQWETDGREIINYDSNIPAFQIVRNSSGDLLIAWVVNSTGGVDNGAYVQKLDAEAAEIWEEDLKLKDGSNSAISLVESAGVYYAAVGANLTGGYYRFFVSKFDLQATLLWPFGGTFPEGAPNSHGHHGISSDNAGGFYLYHSSGNGSGASLKCMRMGGEVPTNLWPAWTTVTAGTSGLNYQFSGIGDANGITFVWEGGGTEGTGTNLYSRRLLSGTGLLDWNETTKLICVADGSQGKFFWKKSANEYFITWADGRPGVVGNSAIYAQKFTVNGVILWPENGIEVADLNTYIPYPEFDLDEDNTMVVIHNSGGQKAHKVFADGTGDWGPGGISIFNSNYSAPYQDFVIRYTGDIFVVTGVTSGNNIYMNAVVVPPVLVSETVTACNSYSVNEQTFETSGVFVIELPGDTILTLDLTIISNIAEVSLSGNTLTSVYDGIFQWYNCDTEMIIEGETSASFTTETPGNYALILQFESCSDTSACEIIAILSTGKDNFERYLEVYPNPGSDMLTIRTDELKGMPLNISFYNSVGQLVEQQTLCATSNCRLNTEKLPSGMYLIEIINENIRYLSKWIKM